MGQDTNGKKILIIDDNEFIRGSIAKLLETVGYTVTEKADGLEGLEFLKENYVDLVISDIKMPVMGGIEVLKKVHEIDLQKPVILITGFPDIEIAFEAVKKDAFDILVKPIDFVILKKSVHKALRFVELLRIEKKYKENNRENIEIAMRLASAAEYGDEIIKNHNVMVGKISSMISEKLNMDNDFTDSIKTAAMMHDIGKSVIPQEILLKNSSLDESETGLVRMHAETGFNMLRGSDSPVLQMAGRISLFHHEQWNGGGYPYGTKGDDIPIEGRIVKIADQYDSLRCTRPFRDSFIHEEAFRIITEGDGRTDPAHFDPAVLDVFKALSSELLNLYLYQADSISTGQSK